MTTWPTHHTSGPPRASALQHYSRMVLLGTSKAQCTVRHTIVAYVFMRSCALILPKVDESFRILVPFSLPQPQRFEERRGTVCASPYSPDLCQVMHLFVTHFLRLIDLPTLIPNSTQTRANTAGCCCPRGSATTPTSMPRANMPTIAAACSARLKTLFSQTGCTCPWATMGAPRRSSCLALQSCARRDRWQSAHMRARAEDRGMRG